jgi:hypothetical protein
MPFCEGHTNSFRYYKLYNVTFAQVHIDFTKQFKKKFEENAIPNTTLNVLSVRVATDLVLSCCYSNLAIHNFLVDWP